MKNRSFHVFSLLCLVAVASCSKSFIDFPNNDMASRQVYIKDLQTFGQYVNGINLAFAGIYSGCNTIYPELVADNIKPIPGSNALTNIYTWTQPNEDNVVYSISLESKSASGFSYDNYAAIVACNYVIDQAPRFRTENPAKVDDFVGQALTMRAFCYWHLVNVFAQAYQFTADASHPGVVYNTGYDFNEPVKGRSSVQEVYQGIISDLEKAIPMLSTTRKSTLVMNKSTAEALLARVLLAKADYQGAKNMAAGIARRVPLLTIANGYPNSLFTLLDLDKTEVFSQTVAGNSASMGFSSGQIGAGYFLRLGTAFSATKDMHELLHEDPADIRHGWTTADGDNRMITKFPSGVIPDVYPPDGAYFTVVIRASEMYLVAAECYAQLNNEDSARYFLDAVRRRANPSIAPVTASGAALIDSIYKERRKELAFEGHRMYDLQRWKQPVVRTDPNSAAAAFLPYPSPYAIAPIPGKDVIQSGVEQNPGY